MQGFLSFPDDSPRALARRNDPATSKLGAADVVPRLSYLQTLFIDVLRFHGPLTAREVERFAANMRRNEFVPDSIRKRAAELVSRGAISELSPRICSVTGKLATVYQVKDTISDERNQQVGNGNGSL